MTSLKNFKVMKKLGFILTILFAILQVNAQDFAFGAKGGINVASVGGNTYAGLGGLASKISFHLGGVAEIPISESSAHKLNCCIRLRVRNGISEVMETA